MYLGILVRVVLVGGGCRSNIEGVEKIREGGNRVESVVNIFEIFGCEGKEKEGNSWRGWGEFGLREGVICFILIR